MVKPPDLTLRIGFAGNRNLPADLTPLQGALDTVFSICAQHLAAVPQVASNLQNGKEVASYYAVGPPLLRLVTGLAKGADTEAAHALQRLPNKQVRTELAAVLGCDVTTYHDSRDPQHQPEFRKQLAACSYVLTLDGSYEAGVAGDTQRARLYRAQADMLLRHTDILVAVADPDAATKPGGTLETVRKALAFELPVVFIHSSTGGITSIRPGSDLTAALANLNPGNGSGTTLSMELGRWITTIVADPDAGIPVTGTKANSRRKEAEEFLEEYFHDDQVPPRNEAGKRRTTFRELLWTFFAKRFDRGPHVASDKPIDGYKDYRARATALNYHYTGLYRGAFVLNYVLAVFAVSCAALSLVLLGKQHTDLGQDVNTAMHAANSAAEAAADHSLLLTALAIAKLIALLTIYFNTKQAHRGKWNERAVNYRYLAERLRTMFYLPQLGSFQPPSASPPQFASRVVRQSAVDWLFDAITRSVSPATFATTTSFTFADETVPVQLITQDPLAQVNLVKESWIKTQVDYHDKNSTQMAAMDHFLEKTGNWLNIVVIAFVSFDLLLLLDHWVHFAPENLSARLHEQAPWLVFFATFLPAAVASLNGIRFQSESQRLAERSAVVRVVLAGRPNGAVAGRMEEALALHAAIQADLTQKPPMGSWNNEALRLGEAVANDLVQEVAEWSVLYAKELAEP